MTDSVEPSKVLVGVLQGWFDDVRPQVHGLSFHMLQNDGCIFQPRIVHDLNHELFFSMHAGMSCCKGIWAGQGRQFNPTAILFEPPFTLCPSLSHHDAPMGRAPMEEDMAARGTALQLQAVVAAQAGDRL